MRSVWSPGEAGRFGVALCARAGAIDQYRVTRWSVMRKDRRPVGCTRKRTSGPAVPAASKVGWMQVKLAQPQEGMSRGLRGIQF